MVGGVVGVGAGPAEPKPPLLSLPQATRKPPASAIKKHSKEFFVVRRVFPVFIPVFPFLLLCNIRSGDRTATGKEGIPLFPVYDNIDSPFSRALYSQATQPRRLPFPLKRNVSHSRNRCQSRIKNFPRRCFRRLRENLLRGIRPVFSPRCRGFFRFLALAAPLARARCFPVDYSSRADLTALAQGRTIGAGKLRFAEKSLSDSRQIARVYRDDGLFFGAVKIESDAARATLVAIIGVTNDNSATEGGVCRFSRRRSGKNYRKPRNANSFQSQLSPAIKGRGRKWWPKLPANAPNTRWCCRPPTDRSI